MSKFKYWDVIRNKEWFKIDALMGSSWVAVAINSFNNLSKLKVLLVY